MWCLFAYSTMLSLSCMQISVMWANYMCVKVLMGLPKIPCFSFTVETPKLKENYPALSLCCDTAHCPWRCVVFACVCTCLCTSACAWYKKRRTQAGRWFSGRRWLYQDLLCFCCCLCCCRCCWARRPCLQLHTHSPLNNSQSIKSFTWVRTWKHF